MPRSLKPLGYRPPIGETRFTSTRFCDVFITTAIPEPARSAFGNAFASALDLECYWLSAVFGHEPPRKFQVHVQPFNEYHNGSGGAEHGANFIIVDLALDDPSTSVGLFLMEAVEQFAAPLGWYPGASNGEALSRFLGMIRYPQLELHYRAGFHWLDSDRHDWINSTDATDRNPISFGCGSLYLFWMFIQLHADLIAIARNGGPNLAYTAARVCPAATFANFRAMTDEVWPPGTVTTGHLFTDCPFPIPL